MPDDPLDIPDAPASRGRRVIRRLLLGLLIVLVLIALFLGALIAFSPTYRRMAQYGNSDIRDHEIFPTRALRPAETSFQFNENLISLDALQERVGDDVDIASTILNTPTVAFLVIQNDELLHESYYRGYERASRVTVFSVSKAITTTLLGCAIRDGFISGLDAPVAKYIPELASAGMDTIQLKHLAQMTAGLNYREMEGNPFCLHARLYYGTDGDAMMMGLRGVRPPGQAFEYQSGATQLLALCLDRALKPRTLTDYLQTTLWNPLGMEFPASWSTDFADPGLEKAYCGIAMSAIDLAKIGRLMLRRGDWNGAQVLPENWVELVTQRDTSEGSAENYQYGWWLLDPEEGDYRAAGHLGQYLYVNPKRNIIIVRFGESTGQLNTAEWGLLLTALARAL
ncbi:MAG: beta-lactamase family protein [Candidatus Hydrogenedentes bacterium]|nr:beta-lactamase family protein [Candidatus Hydrogenedentota bacterium]